MLNIEPRHLEIVKAILSKYDYEFYIFGSRITDKAKKFSDLDLFYKDNIPLRDIFLIEEEFEESNLPYKVDLIDYNSCDKEFQSIMNKNHIILQTKLIK
jgi:predicted nucleotidyltransferase